MHPLFVALVLNASPIPIDSPLPLADRPQAAPLAQSWSCSPRRICSQIATCDEALWYLQYCAWGPRLDADHDGIPCETICGSSR